MFLEQALPDVADLGDFNMMSGHRNTGAEAESSNPSEGNINAPIDSQNGLKETFMFNHGSA